MKLHNSFMCLETSYMFQIRQNSFFFFFFFLGGGGGGELGAELRERKGWLGQLTFFKHMQRKFSYDPKYWNVAI